MTHQWAQPASQLGDDRGLSEDQSPGTAQKGNGACENWALLMPRLRSLRESGRDIAPVRNLYQLQKHRVKHSRLQSRIFFREVERRLGGSGPLTPMRDR
jgi:hypothetical protein